MESRQREIYIGGLRGAADPVLNGELNYGFLRWGVV